MITDVFSAKIVRDCGSSSASLHKDKGVIGVSFLCFYCLVGEPCLSVGNLVELELVFYWLGTKKNMESGALT